MYDLSKAYRSMQKSITTRRVEDWEAGNGQAKDTTRLFHGPWHVPVGEHICALPFRMWNRLRFCRSHKYFKDAKVMQINRILKKKLNLTCQAQSTPKTTGILPKVFNTSGLNLVALAWTSDELSRGHAQNGVNVDFEVKFDLEGQGHSPQKTTGILTEVFYSYGPNLVILAWMGDELSRGQTWWRTDWRTDGQTQATTIPEGQYWPRVKTLLATWKCKKLSIKGTITVIWTLAIPPSLYLANVIHVPPQVISEVKEIITNLLWDGKPPKIAYTVMIQSIKIAEWTQLTLKVT